MTTIDDLWAKLNQANFPDTLLKKHFTSDLFGQLKDKTTKFHGTLADCIRSGCTNPDNAVGLLASDPDAYTVFHPIFDPVIKDIHRLDKLNHPEEVDFLVENPIPDLDPEGSTVVSCRVEVRRNLDTYGFHPVLTKEDLVNVEKKLVTALEKLTGDLKGTYYALTGMSDETRKQLSEDHLLFTDDDRYMRNAGAYKNWPTGRGVFHNPSKTLLTWVNQEDHLRVFSRHEDGNLGEAYTRLVKALNILKTDGELSYSRRSGLGFLTFNPSDLGTTITVSADLKIPNVSAMPDFKELCDNLNIQATAVLAQDHDAQHDVAAVYKISNMRRLGLSENKVLQEFRKGVAHLVAEEKRMSTDDCAVSSG